MSNPTAAEIQKALYGRKKGARIKVVPPEERTADGIVFDSGHEMGEYLKLKSLERAGTIKNLKLQVRYPLLAFRPANREIKQVSTYVADFVFEDLKGRITVADAKGHRTEKYKLAKKWFEFCYAPLYILEI